jgi:hypothetical protein
MAQKMPLINWKKIHHLWKCYSPPVLKEDLRAIKIWGFRTLYFLKRKWMKNLRRTKFEMRNL